jgi:hypothetical protein
VLVVERHPEAAVRKDLVDPSFQCDQLFLHGRAFVMSGSRACGGL